MTGIENVVLGMMVGFSFVMSVWFIIHMVKYH